MLSFEFILSKKIPANVFYLKTYFKVSEARFIMPLISSDDKTRTAFSKQQNYRAISDAYKNSLK